MFPTDRRTFLRVLSSSALAAALPASIDRALAIEANNKNGSIKDIEHIVILIRRTSRSITTSEPCAACAASAIPIRSGCRPESPFGISPMATAICCRSIPTPTIWAPGSSKAHRTIGRTPTALGITANTTPGSRTRAARRCPISRARTSRFTSRSPTPSRSATPIDGLRHARPLPYDLQANGTANFGDDTFEIAFANAGKAGACFHVRSGNGGEGPWTFTVEAGKSLSYLWTIGSSPGRYDLSVYGPNGFVRSFRGGLSGSRANVAAECRYDRDDLALHVVLTNRGAGLARVTIANGYDGKTLERSLLPGQSAATVWDLGIELRLVRSLDHRSL